MMVKSVSVAAAAVAAAVLISGCGSIGSSAEPDSPPAASQVEAPEPTDIGGPVEPASPPEATQGQPPTSAEPTTGPTPASTPASTPGADVPVAVRPGSIDKVKVRASVFPVVRGGGTSTLNVMIESVDPAEPFMIASALGDGDPEVSAKALASVDGIRLVDSTAKKAYLPATTADRKCVCTPTDEGTTMSVETTVWVTVAFAAPPTTLQAVDVVLPVFGTVNNVPVH